MKSNQFIDDQKAEIGGMMGDLFAAVIIVFVLAILASALGPAAITVLSNTTAIAGYSTWGATTQTIWGNLAIFAVLSVLILFVVIPLYLFKRYT